MNILFLNSADSDYGQDILYAGLRKRPDVTLYTFPFNRRWFLPLKKYPRNLGYHWEPAAMLRAYTQRIPWADLDACVLAACNPRALEAFWKILPKLKPHTRLVFVDGGDWPALGGDFERLQGEALYQQLLKHYRFDLLFKREMLEDHSVPGQCRSVSLRLQPGAGAGQLLTQLPTAKKYDVSFWAVESHPIRTQALSLLQDQFDCRANGTQLRQTFHKYRRKGEDYLRELAACKIVLNFRGAGWDTLRYWETPAVGAFLLSQRPQILIPDNFRPGSEIVFCQDDLSDLVELCAHYLAHDTERERIARNGHAWLLKYHSEEARAAYFLDHLQKIV